MSDPPESAATKPVSWVKSLGDALNGSFETAAYGPSMDFQVVETPKRVRAQYQEMLRAATGDLERVHGNMTAYISEYGTPSENMPPEITDRVNQIYQQYEQAFADINERYGGVLNAQRLHELMHIQMETNQALVDTLRDGAGVQNMNEADRALFEQTIISPLQERMEYRSDTMRVMYALNQFEEKHPDVVEGQRASVDPAPGAPTVA